MERWRRYRNPQIYRAETKVPQTKRFFFRPTRPMGIGVAIVITLGLLLWVVAGSTVFKIKTMNIAGEAIPTLEDALQTLSGRNLLFIQEEAIFTELLVIDPSLKSIRFVRGFPDHLQIVVERRHPVLVWEVNNTQWAVDMAGVAFTLDPTTADGIPKVVDSRGQPVTVGERLISPDFVAFTREAFLQSPEIVGGKIIQAEIGETTFHIGLRTEAGWKIILDSTRPLEGQLENLRLLLADYRGDIHEYVDLRLAGWAYIK